MKQAAGLPGARPGALPDTPHIERLADTGIALLLILLMVYLPASSGSVGVESSAVLGLLCLVAIVLFALPRLLGPPGRYPPLRPHLWIVGLLLAVVGLAALQILPLPWGWIRTARPSQASLFESLGVGGQPTPMSVYPFHTKLGLYQLLAASVAFLIGAFWVRRITQVHLILVTYVVVASAVALYGIIQVLSGDQIPFYQFATHPSGGRARGPFVNPNHFSGYLEMAAPIAMALLFSRSRIIPRWGPSPGTAAGASGQAGKSTLILFAFSLIGAGVLRSLSRMGALSFVCALGVLALLLRGKRQRSLLWLGAGLLFVGGLVIFARHGSVFSRLSHLFSRGEAIERVVPWRMAVDVARDYPGIGSGLRTFQDISARYQPAEIPGWYAESHNDYLNLLSDLGILGAVCFGALALLWFMRVRDGWKAISPERGPLLAGCMASIFAMLLHEMADFNLQIPSGAFHFALLAGLAVSIPRLSGPVAGGSPPGSGRRAVVGGLLLLGVGWAGTGMVKMWLADRLLRKGGEENLLRAESLDRSRSDAPHRRGRLLEDRGETVEAERAFLEAVRRNPLSGRSHYKSGVQQVRLGRWEGAVERFRRALEVSPNNPDILERIAMYRLHWWLETTPGKGSEKDLRSVLADLRRAGLLDAARCKPILERLAAVLESVDALRSGRPETGAGHRALGEVLMGKERWREATEELQKWAALAPPRERSRALLAVGEARARDGDFDGARRAFLLGSAETSNRRRFLREAYSRLLAAGAIEAGLPLWRRLNEDPSLRDEARLLEARTLIRLGHSSRAGPILMELRKGLLGSEASFLLFRIEDEAGAPRSAEIYLREAIESRPRDASLRYHLALNLEKQGRIREALLEAEDATRLSPGDAAYSGKLKQLLYRLADGD
ncbi:MAG: O-antigen ligase family protein [Planctomycetota bacterium]|nr:O-antigen ligase family protein [Planctomycetota bacterium]